MTLIKAKLQERAMRCLKGSWFGRHKKPWPHEPSSHQWLSFGGEKVLIPCPGWLTLEPFWHNHPDTWGKKKNIYVRIERTSPLRHGNSQASGSFSVGLLTKCSWKLAALVLYLTTWNCLCLGNSWSSLLKGNVKMYAATPRWETEAQLHRHILTEDDVN